ncbi:Hypp142 [Branchiostoma lanceolatum]|uniref:Hypp142 protein n=1 Tax=Branchiostoma lanceolatum TaxID=7740 RepID=A0A8J9YHR0_BRALA|nr:Hypp142 [Branchiostoma lanceolatum]
MDIFSIFYLIIFPFLLLHFLERIAGIIRGLEGNRIYAFTAALIMIGGVLMGIIYYNIKVVEWKIRSIEATERILTATDTITEKTEVPGWLWGVSRVITRTVEKLRYTPEEVYGYMTGTNKRHLN